MSYPPIRYRIILLLFMLCTAQLQAQPKALELNLENYTYPFPVHFISLNIQGMPYRMAYMDVAPAHANGKTVVLLHGKNFNGAYWRQTADTLSQKGYRVIIPDQLGFGKSSKPQQMQFSFQQLAVNTKALLDSLHTGTIILLGHSMGGMLAVRFTLMYPETVRRLVLEDPIGLEDYKLKVPYQPVDTLYKKELKQDVASLKKYEMENYYNNSWKPEYDEWLYSIAGWTLNKKDYPLIARTNALTTDMLMTQPVVYELKNIKVPVLLIIGQLDKTAPGKDLVSKETAATMGNYPVLGKLAREQIGDCRLVMIGNTGHLPHIQSFGRFIKPLLAFIE